MGHVAEPVTASSAPAVLIKVKTKLTPRYPESEKKKA